VLSVKFKDGVAVMRFIGLLECKVLSVRCYGLRVDPLRLAAYASRLERMCCRGV
jgi:hypothetical protein